MSSTQHRCVFVGNIPYDATEEELVRICEEVGPVVSFRLVVDRDTGKPKGYGFCEYRDEETALSARRNLQGYEINGRQLRVDFAENEKGSADRNREQLKGRGGPGFVDLSKQSGGLKGARDASLHQPVGLPSAVSAAAVMASLLGAPQSSAGSLAQLGVARPPPGIDPLTIHLAGMSKYQLYDVLNQMKNFIQQNQQQARHVLTSNPQLVKALFQAQIILGWVPQVPLQNLQPQPSHMPIQQQVQLHQAPSNPQAQQSLQNTQLQRTQNFPFPGPAPAQNQLANRAGPTMITQQPLPPPPSSLSLTPLNVNVQRSQPQLPLHLNLPPLPQQLRPMVPASPPRGAPVASLQPPLSQLTNVHQMQQPNGPAAVNMPYMGVPPPLPSQPPPHVLQAPRPAGDVAGNGSIVQGGLSTSGGLIIPTSSGLPPLGRGAGTELPSTSASFANWNQLPTSSGPLVGAPLGETTLAMSIPIGLGHSSMLNSNSQQAVLRGGSFEGSGVLQPQEYGQPQMPLPIQQQPTQPLPNQHIPSQPLASQQHPSSQQVSSQQSQQQPQVSLEPEQQKALLQQVMNLTPEQINLLPAEQRQQVIDLQQAFRNQII